MTSKLHLKLQKAIQEENLDDICSLLDKGACLNNSRNGPTPLSIAAFHGKLIALEVLLNYSPASTNCSTPNTPTASNDSSIKFQNKHLVSEKDFEQFTSSLNDYAVLDSCENVSKRNCKGKYIPETPDDNHLEWCDEIESSDSVDDTEDNDVWSNQFKWYADVLSRTATPSVQSCIEIENSRCDVNFQDSTGRTALHYAAEGGHNNAIKLLINRGARLDIGDEVNQIPLTVAVRYGHYHACEILIQSGSNIDSTTIDLLRPLHYASSKGFIDIVELLLINEATIDCLDYNDCTPLKLAVMKNYDEVVELLIKYNAKVNIADYKEKTALNEAVLQRNVKCVKLLMDAGAIIQPLLLHTAVLLHDIEIVKLLTTKQIFLNFADSSGSTAIYFACISNQEKIVRFLIKRGAHLPQLSRIICRKGPILAEIILILLEHCEEMTCEHSKKQALLYCIAIMSLIAGKINIVALILGLGIDLNAVNINQVKKELPLYHFGNISEYVLALPFLSTVYTICDVQVLQLLFWNGYRPLERESELVSLIGKGNYSTNLSEKSNRSEKEFKEVLKFYRTNPLKLTDLCRISIRKNMKNFCLKKWNGYELYITELGLPKKLQNFLLFRDYTGIAENCNESRTDYNASAETLIYPSQNKINDDLVNFKIIMPTHSVDEESEEDDYPSPNYESSGFQNFCELNDDENYLFTRLMALDV